MAAVAELAGDGAGEGVGDDTPAEPCTKRRKTHMPLEVKEWFCSLARVKPNWTMTQCLRFAKTALPSFFEHAHIDTTRKWFSQKTSGTALAARAPWNPAVLALADIVSRVCSRVCCGSGVLTELLNAQLETLGGVQYRFSERHTRRFMRSLGYTFKKFKGELGKEWPEATTRTLRELCQQKIEWTLNDAGIIDRTRIINIDETCCQMWLLLERKWLASGELPVVMDTRRNITVFLAPTHFPGQDLRRGTRQPLPIAGDHLSFGELLDDADDPHSLPHMAGHHCHERRWQQSPMDLLHGRVYRARQSRVPGPPCGDACPRPARLRAAQPNTTAVCQPLDRACMRPFKAARGRSSARDVGREIQHHPRRRCQHHPQHCWHAQPHHALDPRRGEGDRHDAPQHSSLVRHRLHACQPG